MALKHDLFTKLQVYEQAKTAVEAGHVGGAPLEGELVLSKNKHALFM